MKTRFESGLTAALHAAALLTMLATGALASSIEEDNEDVSGADRTITPPAALLAGMRQRAAETGFGWVVGLGAYVANDDNVFRSPAGLEQTSGAWGDAGYLRADARWHRRTRSLTTLTWNRTRFRTFDQIDSSHPHLSQWLQYRLSATTAVELDVDVVHQNDDATTITGFAYTRDYGYWRYGGEGTLEWAPGTRHRVRLGAERVRKDYGEVPAFNSLDWGHWRANASYRFRLGPSHVVGLKLQQGERTYDEEPASLADGNETPGNPTEHHRYRDWIVWYGAPLGSRVEIDASAAFGTKTDLFQGYEDYRDRDLRLSVVARPLGGLEVRGAVQAGHRAYDRIAADAGARLAYDTFEARLGARVRLIDGLWVHGDVNTFQRDTNRSSGLDYRDYHGVFSRVGLSLYH